VTSSSRPSSGIDAGRAFGGGVELRRIDARRSGNAAMTLPAQQLAVHTRRLSMTISPVAQEAVAERVRPLRRPSTSPGTTRAAMQQDQAMHRAHELMFAVSPAHQLRDRQLLQRVRDDLGQVLVEFGSPGFSRGRRSTRPCRRVIFCSCAKLTPAARMKPSRALVGWPAASRALATAGPFFSSTRSGWRPATPVMVSARRRGVA
jgi:hypothetical protein